MSHLDELSLQSATEVGQALSRREVMSVELTAYLLDRIAAQPGPIFLTVTAERAMAEARAADARLDAGRPLSPLDGVPVAWKDLFDLAGEVTTAGSETRRTADPAVTDSVAAMNLARAGMVSIGKVNLTEFAYSGLGLNPHFGTPHNPHGSGPAHAPGGSSSGSAVAVASGLAPCAIGTDTGGSVRVPAAFNGIYGYKPSRGRIPDGGCFPLSRTLDTVGPLGRSVADLVALEAALRGGVPVPDGMRDIRGLRVLVPQSVVFDEAEQAVVSNFEATIARLASAGAIVERIDFPPFEECVELGGKHGSLAAADAYVEHRVLVESDEVTRVDPRVVDRLLGGRSMTAADVVTLQRARSRLIAETRELLGNALLAFPTVAHVAPEIAPLEADRDLFHSVNLKTLRNTILGNFLDTPGVSIPSGTSEDGMPTGLLLSAASGQDDLLLTASLAVSRCLSPA